MRDIRLASIQPLSMARPSPFDREVTPELARQSVEANLDLACRLLDQAGAAGCDLACYPEDVQGIAHYGYYLDDPTLFTSPIETVPGPATERLAAIARRHSMNVVFGTYERVGDALYNTAVLMGRQGEIIGKYHKVHLPAVERWAVTPGNGFPVFRADFGLVGLLICYDVMFPEATRCLSLNGAEILLNPTMGFEGPGQCEGNGLIRLRMRALDSYAPLVVSKCGSGTLIVGSDGGLLAEAPPDTETIITASVDLDATPADHSQWELLTGTSNVKARFLQERLPETYRALTSSHPPALDQFAAHRLRSAPEEVDEAYRELRRRWSPGG